MKTLDKLRLMLFMCLLMLSYLLFYPNIDNEAEIKKKLKYEEIIWKQKHIQAIDFDDVRWDGVVRFHNGRYEVGKYCHFFYVTGQVRVPDSYI